MLRYTYAHKETRATTGYFHCLPDPQPGLEQTLAALRQSPMDEFMHRHALSLLLRMPQEDLAAMAQAAAGADPTLQALLVESALLNPQLSALERHLAGADLHLLDAHTPLPYIRGSQLPDQDAHRAARAYFSANIHEHHPLPHPDDEDMPLLYAPEGMEEEKPEFGAAEAFSLMGAKAGRAPCAPPPGAEETAALAIERLSAAGIIAGPEMRHESSLSPIALLRAWKLDVTVKNGSLDYALSGTANVYGRGLTLPAARASCHMEMVERASAYASVDGTRLPMLAEGGEMIRAAWADLERDGIAALHPDALPLDMPYNGRPLHWMRAAEAGTGREVFVPAQFVFLFWNADEPALLAAPGSTGLASGSSPAGAKLSALCEIIERDAEATLPYRRSRCFSLAADEPRIQALLNDYAQRGIQVRFQNLTRFGVPCYQSFVSGQNGALFKAAGAGLCGRGALLSALTETPYPYPGGEPSAPGLGGLPRVNLESLPDFSTGRAENDLRLMEEILIRNGIRPLYVNITRKDLGIPVVRAIAPGLETGAEFDSFSRIRPRLYRNYLSGK